MAKKSSGFNLRIQIKPAKQICKEHGLDESGFVTRYLRDTMDRLMMPFVPGGPGGMLAKNKTYPSAHEIKYTSPYAKYQYYGKLMLAENGSSWAKKGEKKHLTSKNLKYHTSGAGAKWDRLMLQRKGKDLTSDVEKFARAGGKK